MSALLGILRKEDIDNLSVRYDEVEAKLANTETSLDQVNQNQEDIQILNKIMVHLQATDAITLAQHSMRQEDIAYASSLVQESINLGNDETINLDRLENL